MRYWFIRKTYGYGWTPATWEGWLVLTLYVVASVLTYLIVYPRADSAQNIVLWFVLPFVCYTALLLLTAYKKGEKPRWQWGNEK